jgi:ABC-type transporter Mla MlaB component
MLKITVLEQPEAVAIKLEGRLGGPWTTELARTWKSLFPSLNSRKCSLDLCDVTWVDTEGRHLLREIYEQSGADFVSNTPMSKYFAAVAMRIDGTENED